jgi:hypothetical protein
MPVTAIMLSLTFFTFDFIQGETMITKLIAAIALAVSSQIALADTAGIWADGVVTYPHPNGKLVNRECQLFVPARGQGDVTLKCGKWSATTSEFKTKHESGKTVFSVIFHDVPGAPAGTSALYSGAYLRGSNRALYYGDVFSGTGNTLSVESMDGWNYTGGFMFAKDITADSN